MGYYKFLLNPDYLEDIDDAGVYDKIPLPKKGGIIEDPKRKKPTTLGTMDRSGLYFTDSADAWYYLTYGKYVAEVFPINGVPLRRCFDKDGEDTCAHGWYAPKIRIGPIHEVDAKFYYRLIVEGARLDTLEYNNTCEVFSQMLNDITKDITKKRKPKKWPIRVCQIMIAKLSQLDLDVFNEFWDTFFKLLELGDGIDIYWYMYPIIANDAFDLSANGTGFSLLTAFKNLKKSGPITENADRCIRMYLLRLRKEYPAVYATCPGFPEYDKIVLSGTDPDGFTHLLPRYHGCYDNWRVNTRR